MSTANRNTTDESAAAPLAGPVEGGPILEARGLHKSYARGKQRVEAVRGVDLAVAPREVLGFLGPNGAGKTTTIRMIAGLVEPDAGAIRVLGLDPHRSPDALGHIGVVLEGNRNLFHRLTARENLVYFGVLRGLRRRKAAARADELLERFGLGRWAPLQVTALSRGLQQRVAIAAALLHEPALLLLDEPTLGLDVEAAEQVKGMIVQLAAEGRAVLLTTHQMEVAEELAHRIAVIREGRIVADQATGALIDRFARPHFVIQLATPLPTDRVNPLLELGALVNGQEVTVEGNPERLWTVLRALEGLELVLVHRPKPGLGEILIQLIRGERA